MNAVWQDLRYSIRLLSKSPGFLFIVLLLLALGIGLNTAIFGVVHSIVLKPLPYPDSANLITIWGKIPSQGLDQLSVSPAEYRDYRNKTRTFSEMAAYGSTSFNLLTATDPERLTGTWASGELFSVLGVKPSHGRVFTSHEDKPGNDRVLILSYTLWQKKFGGNLSAIGSSVIVNGDKHTIIGVMPKTFQFPDRHTEAWFPIAFTSDQLSETERGSHWLEVVARLKPGTTHQQAAADLHTVALQLQKEHPGDYLKNSGWDIYPIPLRNLLVGGNLKLAMTVLLGAVAFVLLIACANIAGLMLARINSRSKEIAVRMALGAGFKHVMRQLLIESLFLSLLGGIAGVLLAVWGMDLLLAFLPENMPRIEEVQIDWRVMAFSFLLSAITGIFFGTVPAIQARKLDVQRRLAEGSRALTDTVERRRFHDGLVVIEIGLALILLTGAGLLMKSLFKLQQASVGFRKADVITMRVSLPKSSYPERHQQQAFFSSLMERLKSIPAIRSAGIVNFLPLSGLGNQRDFSIEGQGHMLQNVEFRVISSDYFQAIGIPLLMGRGFDEKDRHDAPFVAIINKTMARIFFAHENALGKRIKLGNVDGPFPWLTVVGVVNDVKHYDLESTVDPEMYVHYLQPLLPDFQSQSFSLAVATKQNSNDVISDIRAAVRTLDPGLPVYSIASTEDLIERSLGPRRFHMYLLVLFAVCALVLAAAGIFALISYSISRRTHEIGIRVALGAMQKDVMKLILGQGVLLSLLGIGAGVIAALALTRLMSTMLYGIHATDFSTFALGSFLLFFVTVLASAIPTWRATKIDPIRTLRND